MNNTFYLLSILVLALILMVILSLMATGYNLLLPTLGSNNTAIILIFVATLIGYIVLSLMIIQLVVGLILYLIGYGKTDESLVKYLTKEFGYSENEAARIVDRMGSEGTLFFKDTVVQDLDQAGKYQFKFNGAETFKSVSIMLYVFSIGIIFVLGVSALSTLNTNTLPNDAAYGLLLSSVVLSGVSLVMVGVIYYLLVKKNAKYVQKAKEDREELMRRIKNISS